KSRNKQHGAREQSKERAADNAPAIARRFDVRTRGLLGRGWPVALHHHVRWPELLRIGSHRSGPDRTAQRRTRNPVCAASQHTPALALSLPLRQDDARDIVT